MTTNGPTQSDTLNGKAYDTVSQRDEAEEVRFLSSPTALPMRRRFSHHVHRRRGAVGGDTMYANVA